MKRDPRLQGLSSEHHHALVLARALGSRAQPWTAVDGEQLAERFDTEIEPHFRTEEALLLPALRQAGAQALCERIECDHAAIRSLLQLARSGDAAALRGFADQLTEHVRFEERELFPACEALLSSELLDAVAARAPKAR